MGAPKMAAVGPPGPQAFADLHFAGWAEARIGPGLLQRDLAAGASLATKRFVWCSFQQKSFFFGGGKGSSQMFDFHSCDLSIFPVEWETKHLCINSGNVTDKNCWILQDWLWLLWLGLFQNFRNNSCCLKVYIRCWRGWACPESLVLASSISGKTKLFQTNLQDICGVWLLVCFHVGCVRGGAQSNVCRQSVR